MNMTKLTVLFFVRRIGPYHHARFQEATKIMNLIVVETRPGSQEYPWEFNASKNYQSDRFTTDKNPENGIRGQELTRTICDLFENYTPHVVVTTGWADAEYHAI